MGIAITASDAPLLRESNGLTFPINRTDAHMNAPVARRRVRRANGADKFREPQIHRTLRTVMTANVATSPFCAGLIIILYSQR